jgi:hypothetical protein
MDLAGRPDLDFLYHQTHTLRICHVHYQRNVREVLGKGFSTAPDSIYQRMMALLDAPNEAAFEHKLVTIRGIYNFTLSALRVVLIK